MIRSIKENVVVENEAVSPNMELRHLQYNHRTQLSRILDNNESWKSLMEKIPKNLAEIQQEDILRKYSAEHIQQIDETSKQRGRSPTDILFDEWGTSGRTRATVGDLLELLKKVQLYRAADFVAMQVLKIAPPQRPTKGPGARIDTTLPTVTFDAEAIEEILKYANPDSSQIAAAAIFDSIVNNNNRDFNLVNRVDRDKLIELPQSCSDLESDSDLLSNSDSENESSNMMAVPYNPKPSSTQECVLPLVVKDSRPAQRNNEDNRAIEQTSDSIISNDGATENIPALSILNGVIYDKV